MVDITDTVRTIGAGIIGIAILVAVLSPLFSFAIAETSGEAVLEPPPESATAVPEIGQAPDNLRVRATTGNALYLDGGGSYVDDPTNESVFADGSWTVAMVAEPSREGRITPNTTATLYAADNENVHVLVEEGNWTARYDHAGGSAYVEAPADLDRRTPVAASYNTSVGELELYVDGQLADSAPLTATTVPRDPAYSWIGSLDEVRVWNAALPASAHNAYAADPVEPQPANATVRLMFNDGLVTTAYYADGDATLVGDTALVDGVDAPGLVRGTDYTIETEPFTFRAVDGGYLDGAPVVFLGGAGGVFGGLLDQLTNVGTTALGLLVIGLLVGAAVWVQDQFSEF